MNDKEARDLLVDNFFKVMRGESVEAKGDIFTPPQTLNAIWMTLDLSIRMLLKKTNPNIEEFRANLQQSFRTVLDSFDSVAPAPKRTGLE